MGPTWITCGLLWKKHCRDSNNWIWLLNIEYRKLAKKQESTTGFVAVTSCEGFGLHILMAVLVAKHSTAYCILIPGSRLALLSSNRCFQCVLQLLYPLACHTNWWMLYSTRPEEMRSDGNLLSVFSLVHNLLWFYEIEGLRLTYSHYQRSWAWDDVHYLWRVQRWYGETHKSQMKTRILVDSSCQQALSTFLKSWIAMQCIIRPGLKFDFWKIDSSSEYFESLFLKSLIAMQAMQV